MPVVGTVDVAVHLHRFYNIDLFCRGVYHLRLSVLLPSTSRHSPGASGLDGSQKSDRGARTSAGTGEASSESSEAQGIPYMCLAQCEDVDTVVGHRRVPPLKEHRLQGPAVHGNYYHSRMFVIRYRDEELELGEVVNFQIPVELNAGRRWLEAGQALVLQMELLFSKLDALEADDAASAAAGAGKATNGAASPMGGTGKDDKGERGLRLEPVAVQRFHASLGGGHWGIHAYVPVTFNGVHFVRVDCMVHGVLRNLKLEAPQARMQGTVQPAALGAIGMNGGEGFSGETQQPRFSGRESEDDEEADAASMPAEFDRLVSAESGAASADGDDPSSNKRRSIPKPTRKFTWFSMYDDQGIGGRRNSKRRLGSSDSLGEVSGFPMGDDVTPQSKGDKHSWRWGWGSRRRSASTATGGGAGAGGRGTPGAHDGAKEVDDGDVDGPQELELLTMTSLSVPGQSRTKRIAELAREGRRRRRKDVYSYFIMPLLRALEAQTGTASWLRKVLEAKHRRDIPKSAVSLWMPPDPTCWNDVARVLWRLFAPDDVDVECASGDERATETQGAGARSGQRTPSAGATAGIGSEKELPPMAKVAFPGLITRYCRDEEGAGAAVGADASAATWLDDDESTCKALELDVHSLAMLVFVEWREFLSALPGCGAVLSKETSALWLAQIRQRWACQATLHTCSALQKPPPRMSTSESSSEIPYVAFDNDGLPSKLPASSQGAPLLSRLEPELGSESFGTAVRLACADASAPYKLPLQDQHMFPEGEGVLPVCLVQRYEGHQRDSERKRADSLARQSEEMGSFVASSRSPPLSPVWVQNLTPAFRRSSSRLPTDVESPPPSPPPPLPLPLPPPPPRREGRSVAAFRSLPSSLEKGTATAPASPVARVPARGLRQRAFSTSPRASRSKVATLDASTAAAAVAAAVAAISGEVSDDSGVSPVHSVGRHSRSGRVWRTFSGSVSPSGRGADESMEDAGLTAADVEGTPQTPPVRVLGRQKHFKSLSPLKLKGVGFFSSPRRLHRRRATAHVIGATSTDSLRRLAEVDARANIHGIDDERASDTVGGIWAVDANKTPDGRSALCPAAAAAPSVSAGSSLPRDVRDSPAPETPRRPLRLKAPTHARSVTSPSLPAPAARMPETPARVPASPLRRSPSASPARPPPKPMADERGRGNRNADGDDRCHSRGGSDDLDWSSSKAVYAGSSLLDGVEQSSDLGAFFRQDEGHVRRRRGRGRAFPPAAGTDGDDEDDDDEEEENGRGAGVGLHVIVLHHGYCGSSMDMRLIKNYIRILAPSALVLNAESNERDQHTSMKVMGENLAKEVHRFLLMRARSLLLPGGQGRLSFMGHSAGAIIIRAALTHRILRPALGRLHMFVSLGTPHLGTVYGSSGIVRTGMWAMKRWMKSRLLEEIGLTDAAQPRDTLLCWLSKQQGLEYFRHVVLVSADKDGYVPPQSARVQMCDASVRDAMREVSHGQVVCEMARSILSPINDKSLYRLHLWGGGKLASSGGGGVDEYIGRTAHISMMDSPSLVCLLLCTLLDLIL